MIGFEPLANWLYGSGDMLMTSCRIISFLFSLEMASYLVSLITNIASKGAK